MCGVPIADGSQSVFEQKETKLRIRGISYSRLETRLIYRYLSNTPGGGGRGAPLVCPASVCKLMHDIKKSKGTQ